MKNVTTIQRTIRSFVWERWLERPYGTFVLSLFGGANARSTMKRFGVNAEYRSCLFQENWWYESRDVTAPYAAQLKRYLKNGGTVARISRLCEQYYTKGLRDIKKALQPSLSVREKLEVLRQAEANVTPFIWLAHGFDDVYTEWLEKEVPKYIDGNVAKYIGDVTLPKKKTAASKMEQLMRAGADPALIAHQFGWMKARTGFSAPFTVAEIRSEQRHFRDEKPFVHHRRAVPAKLRRLVQEATEVVYLRTLRTDAIFEILYRARPIMQDAARAFGMTFHELADYSIHDLIAGKPAYFPKTVFATDGSAFGFFKRSIIQSVAANSSEIKGTIAFQGIVRGRVRIMKVAEDGTNMKAGEILVAPMTFPSFIIAMKRAAAFVTDEGGLTCHAAIVAREMHKPCIVGTKYATRVLKNGDLVEVDAITGRVRKI